jgi:uncharacterized repeat protein (TIGR01451 family)
VSGESDVTVPEVTGPAITVAKTAAPMSFSRAGQAISYSYLVTNTGDVTLSGIGVTDGRTGLSAVSCPDATLAAGASETCTASYVTTGADVEAGSVVNTATAHGTPPDSETPAVSAPSSVTVPAVQRPALTVAKTAAPATFDMTGELITFSYLVTNTGNVTLTDVKVKDTLSGLSPVSCPAATLAAGATETCAATYRVTSADMRAGSVRNHAVANGDPPGKSRPVTSTASVVTVYEFGPAPPPPVPVTG